MYEKGLESPSNITAGFSSFHHIAKYRDNVLVNIANKKKCVKVIFSRKCFKNTIGLS